MSKRKNEYRRPSTASFITWWAVSYTALWIAMWGLLEASPPNALNWPMCTVGTVFMVVLISTLQAQLGRRFFNHSMQGWVDSSSVGALLSIVFLAAVSPLDPARSALILTLPTALVQTLWLARHTRGGWLWPLTSLLVLLPAAQFDAWHKTGVFAMLLPLIGLAQGTLQGIGISQLWAAIPRRGKPKRLSLPDQSEDDAAIQRLSVRETSDDVIDERSRVTPQARQADLS